MSGEIKIQSPFICACENCEFSEGDCKKAGVCERAFSIKISIEEELETPGQSDLPDKIAERRCSHPQAEEMVIVGKQVLVQTRGEA